MEEETVKVEKAIKATASLRRAVEETVNAMMKVSEAAVQVILREKQKMTEAENAKKAAGEAREKAAEADRVRLDAEQEAAKAKTLAEAAAKLRQEVAENIAKAAKKAAVKQRREHAKPQTIAIRMKDPVSKCFPRCLLSRSRANESTWCAM